jgi:hypothetical protein
VNDRPDEGDRLWFSILRGEVTFPVDPLPNPATLTVGELQLIVRAIERIHRAAGSAPGEMNGQYAPEEMGRLTRRELVLAYAPEFEAFKTYANAKLGLYVTPEAVERVIHQLAARLGTSFDAVRGLTLVSAVAILNQASQPAESPDPRRHPKDRLKKGAAALLILSALDSLVQNGEWGLTEEKIYRRANVSRATFYRLKNQDERIRPALSAYYRASRGRGPTRSKDF